MAELVCRPCRGRRIHSSSSLGGLRYDWGFNELSALFLIAGFAIGLVAGHSLNDTAVLFLKGISQCRRSADRRC